MYLSNLALIYAVTDVSSELALFIILQHRSSSFFKKGFLLSLIYFLLLWFSVTFAVVSKKEHLFLLTLHSVLDSDKFANSFTRATTASKTLLATNAFFTITMAELYRVSESKFGGSHLSSNFFLHFINKSLVFTIYRIAENWSPSLSCHAFFS